MATCKNPFTKSKSFIFFSFSIGISRPIVNIRNTIPNSAINSNSWFWELILNIGAIIAPVRIYPIICEIDSFFKIRFKMVAKARDKNIINSVVSIFVFYPKGKQLFAFFVYKIDCKIIFKLFKNYNF